MQEGSGQRSEARKRYAAIIDMPHHQSATRPHMSLYDRAAQFAPFAALTGYDDMITEEARLTDNRIELAESEKEILNGKLENIKEALNNGERPVIEVTYFVPDRLKQGGTYETKEAAVKKIDKIRKAIIFDEKTGIAGTDLSIVIDDIIEICP